MIDFCGDTCNNRGAEGNAVFLFADKESLFTYNTRSLSKNRQSVDSDFLFRGKMKCIAKVYRVDEWHLLSSEIKRRDHYVCQSCLKRFKADLLTVHHIFGREVGGDDDPDNLISLCAECHNEIEELGFMTAKDIHGFKAEDAEKEKATRERMHIQALEEMLARVDATRPEWHKWVYGGDRNPYINGRR